MSKQFNIREVLADICEHLEDEDFTSAQQVARNAGLAALAQQGVGDAAPRLMWDALQELAMRCDDSDDAMFGTLSVSFVRGVIEPALAAQSAQPEQKATGAWISVDALMPDPGRTVLAAYMNSVGNWRLARAQWVPAKFLESSVESDIGEYDEAADTFYDPKGWYERMDNWDDYTSVFIHEGTVTHWMDMPAAPDSNATGDTHD